MPNSHRYCKDEKKILSAIVWLIESIQHDFFSSLLTEAHPCLVHKEKSPESKDKCKIHQDLIYTEESPSSDWEFLPICDTSPFIISKLEKSGRDGVLPEWLHHFILSGARAFQVAQVNCLPLRETWVQTLSQENPVEEEMGTQSSILAWEIPWKEETGVLQSIGLQRVGHDWVHLHASGTVVWCSFKTEMTMIEWKHTCSPSYISNMKLCDLVTALHVCLNPLLSPLEKEQCPQNTWLQRFTLYIHIIYRDASLLTTTLFRHVFSEVDPA